MWDEFKKDFIAKYNEAEFNEVSDLVDRALSDEKVRLLNGAVWSLTQDVEKLHVLQYTHYHSLSKEGNDGDEEVSISFENGINNGTDILDYSLDGSNSVPYTKMEEVFVDIEPDWEKIEKNRKHELTEIGRQNIQSIFDYNKIAIMKLLGKRSYDNYVTGGGTTKTEEFYDKKIKAWHDRGFYWNKVYETMEVNGNFI